MTDFSTVETLEGNVSISFCIPGNVGISNMDATAIFDATHSGYPNTFQQLDDRTCFTFRDTVSSRKSLIGGFVIKIDSFLKRTFDIIYVFHDVHDMNVNLSSQMK